MCQSGANPGNSNAVKNKNKSANLQNSFVSQTQAADMLNVSERSVATAKKVQEAAIPDLELPGKCPEVKVKDKETRCLELVGICPQVKGRETRDLAAEKSGSVGILAGISLFLYAFLGSKFLNPAYLLHRHRLVRHKVKDKEKNGLGTSGNFS